MTKKYNFWWEQDGELKNSSEKTPFDVVYNIKTKLKNKKNINGLGCVSSVEINMFNQYINELIEILNPDEELKKKILKYKKIVLDKTTYTNWSGD